MWFAATPEFDEALRTRFLTTYRAAAEGRLREWEGTSSGALARVKEMRGYIISSLAT
ncbi:MAG TPA: DUF924 family protein [Candidatus Competibacteraceae bacterium]|nr:DUF924 family protein [Candidatus Competibacteraceae bacterium]MCP5134972.1 DUF924 family protein [Gammaproteobacteria bacterium]HPF58568.1 DUF924 family protein [Candidatus Competibacteraceae bacterium]HRY18285.1 DUF924 family protein [Candidatus Competibacteraceae bacterium]